MSANINLPINRQTIDALFSFVENVVPSWKPVLELVRQLIDGALPATHPYKATLATAPVSMTQDDLQAWVDQAFQFVEAAVSSTVWLPAVLKGINLVVDQAALPLLAAWLKNLGILS